MFLQQKNNVFVEAVALSSTGNPAEKRIIPPCLTGGYSSALCPEKQAATWCLRMPTTKELQRARCPVPSRPHSSRSRGAVATATMETSGKGSLHGMNREALQEWGEAAAGSGRRKCGSSTQSPAERCPFSNRCSKGASMSGPHPRLPGNPGQPALRSSVIRGWPALSALHLSRAEWLPPWPGDPGMC